MREDTELGILLVEVPGDPGGALPQSQDLGCDLISLPLPAPRLSAGSEILRSQRVSRSTRILRGGDLGVKVELIDVDPLVAGESGVPAPGLEAQPGLVLVLPGLHVLPGLQGQLVQPAAHHVPALVQGGLLVLVLYGHQGPGLYQVLRNVCVSPEAGIVEGRVPMLVHKVHVGLLSEELREENLVKKTELRQTVPTHHLDDLSVPVGRGHVERGVVAHVGGVNPRTPGDQHLHDLHMAALGGPV